MANFRTKARAIDLLGKNQIADLPTAITELWKNGYDAYGDYLDAKLFLAGYKGITYNIFWLSDDGHGMTQEDILNKWVVLGTDNKRNTDHVIPEEDRFGKEIRVPLGEKGIGRLSVSYLGNHMIMITKKKNRAAQMLFMNWRVLENHEMFLEDVEIPVLEIDSFSSMQEIYASLLKDYQKNFENSTWSDFEDLKQIIEEELTKYSSLPDYVLDKIEKHYNRFEHGTIFLILNPIDELVNLESEQHSEIREDRSAQKDYSSYVKSTLSGLFNPFDEGLIKKREIVIGNYLLSPSFYIYNADGSEHDFLGTDFFTRDDFEQCEHWIDGIIDNQGIFNGKIKVFGDVKDYCFSPRIKARSHFGELVIKVAFWEGTRSNSSMPEEKWNIYNKKGALYSGLYIYRDGFRVLPYGKADYDFLGFEKDRSKSAGTYYFSYRKMFGYIGITKKGNAELIDKAGREGFVSNESYREFRRILKGFFNKVAADNYSTKSEARVQHLQEKQKESDREKLVEIAGKKNYQNVMILLERAETNEKLLSELNDSQMMVKEKLSFASSYSDSEYSSLLSQIDDILKGVGKLRIYVPSDVSLYGYDEVEDYIDDINLTCTKMETEALKMIKLIEKKTSIETFIERYKKRSNEISERILDEGTNALERIKCDCSSLYSETLRTYEIRKKEFDELLYDDVVLRNISLEKLEAEYNRLSKMSKEFSNYIQDELSVLAEHIEGIIQNKYWINTLTAYQDTTAELSHRLDTFYELAQVGMAIDVVDHQFNVLYEQIGKNIDRLERIQTEPEVADTISLLKMEFQHMEDNQKMLMPLYRKTRNRRKEITGYDIRNTIMQFYGELFEKNDVSFETTGAFLNYSLSSYESVIMPVFLNIINNAIYWVEYSTGKKVIRIDVKGEEILIMNSGPKMTHTELTRCFELFYTKKSADAGRGIGLYLARRNLNSVNMEIYASNDNDYNLLDGACFVIRKDE